jgi:hypothetical protein
MIICFTTCKQNFSFANYLRSIKIFEQRRSLTRFRISAFRLNIKRGSYQGNSLSKRDFCFTCKKNMIDDEKHFLLSSSSRLSEERDFFYSR